MSAQSIKLCVQVGVDRVNLSIEVHCHALMCLKNPLKYLLNLALLSTRRWLLVVGTSKIPVVAVGFLVLRTLVEISPISIGISISTLVSRPLETCSTNEVYFFFFSTLCLYSFCIFNQAGLLPEELVNTVRLCLYLIHLIIPKDGGRSPPLKISVLGVVARC